MSEMNLGRGAKLVFNGNIDKDVAKAAMDGAMAAAAKYKALMESNPQIRDSMNVRYMFEHRGLPWLWLKKPDLFSPESIHDIVGMTWATSAKFAQIPEPPPIPEVKSEHVSSDDADVIILRMPIPVMIPFCYRIAMVAFHDGRKPIYLTQEKSMEPGKSALCSWEMEGEGGGLNSLRHGNYGVMMSRLRSDFVAGVTAVMSGKLGLSSRLEID